MNRRIIAIVCCSLAMIASGMAQETMLWDGESQAIGSRGGCWDDGNPTVVANPDKSGINPSSKCLMFTMTNSSKMVKIPFRDWTTPSMNGSRRISLMIKKPQNENVKIELSDPTNGSAPYWEKVASWYSGEGEWEKLFFDFSTNGPFDCPGIISITAQTASVVGSQAVYIDNVMLEGATRVNGRKLMDISAGELSGTLQLSGSWASGQCSNVNNEQNWRTVLFDDYGLLATKMSARTTSVDLRGASVKNSRNVFAAVNPNILIFANRQFEDHSHYINPSTATRVIVDEQPQQYTYFKPEECFVGDPMPFYDEQTHQFRVMFLADYRPNPATYHPLHMAVSDNLSSFDYRGRVISCGTLESLDPALGTGSIVYKDGVYYTFYTGHRDQGSNRENILMATSTDGEVWTKNGSFCLSPSAGYDSNEFRDPHIFQHNGEYHMVLSAIKDGLGVIAHYTSVNLFDWTLQAPLLTCENYGSFYECADVFQLGGRWYLIYSDKNDRKVHYRYAESLQGPWVVPVNGGALDGTSFYAGKTAFDGYDRYLFGWCATRPNGNNTADNDWAGALVIHKLYKTDDGTLATTIPHTFDAKYRTQLPASPQSINNASSTSSGYSMQTGGRVSFERMKYQNKINLDVTAPNGNEVFGLTLVDNSDLQDKYSIRLNLASRTLGFYKDVVGSSSTLINQVSLPLSADGRYNLRFSSEQSVCTIYVNNQTALTCRIYGMDYNPWSIFCDSGSVEISQLQWFSY